ncbi:MAG: hypothetical protein ABI456_10705 [Ktedonobacteraceae bacterium]
MPATMMRRSMRQFLLAYLSAFVVIAFMTIIAQVLIQVSLAQTAHQRAVAGIVNRQELYSQVLLRNSILLITPESPATHQKTVSDLHLRYILWHDTAESMYGTSTAVPITPHDISASDYAHLLSVKPDYSEVDTALQQVFVLEQAPKPDIKAVAKQVGIMFYHEPVYLTVLVAVYNAEAALTDAAMTLIAQLEIGACLFTLLTLCLEGLLVIRPAHKQFRAAVDLIDARKQVQAASAPPTIQPQGGISA